MQKIHLGIIGFGVVGSGVVKILLQNKQIFQKRLGLEIELTALADLDLKTQRGVKIDPKILTTNGLKVCRDPKIDLIIETVGGQNFAKQVILTALQNNKHVITANKALLAEQGSQLFSLAQKKQKLLLFEAAVGGAIPLVRTLRTDFRGEQLLKIAGILNGTSNYILTALAKGQRKFSEVLAEAQKLGFAEADPTLDLSGYDAAHKIALIARLAFDTIIPFSQIPITGITNLISADFKFARLLKHTIKLIAEINYCKNSLEIHVQPTLLPDDSLLSKVAGVTNAVTFFGQNCGEITLAGPGAGSLPTATAIIADVLEATQRIQQERSKLGPQAAVPLLNKIPLQKNSLLKNEYYLRFLVRDEPGILAKITNIFGKFELNIRDILQLDLKEFKKAVPLAIILHQADEKRVQAALQKIKTIKCMKEAPVCLRFES